MIKLFLRSAAVCSNSIDTMCVASELQVSQQQNYIYTLSMRGYRDRSPSYSTCTLLIKALIWASIYGSAVLPGLLVLQSLRLHCLCTPLMCSTVCFAVY